jgi:hypothetical protein
LPRNAITHRLGQFGLPGTELPSEHNQWLSPLDVVEKRLVRRDVAFLPMRGGQYDIPGRLVEAFEIMVHEVRESAIELSGRDGAGTERCLKLYFPIRRSP